MAFPSTTSLESVWEGESTADAFGTNTLTNNNVVTFTPGKIGNAGTYIAAASQSLSCASNSSLQAGDVEISGTAWVKLTDKSDRYAIQTKHDGATAGGSEYYLLYFLDFDRFSLLLYGSAGGMVFNFDQLGSPTAGVWYFLSWTHDPVANSVTVSGNAGTRDTTSYSFGINTTSAPFNLGAIATSGAYMNGQIDQTTLWKRVLSTTDESDLYAGGAGVAYGGGGGGGGGSLLPFTNNRLLLPCK